MRKIPIEQDLRIDVEWNLGLSRQRYTDETQSGKRIVTESKFSALLEEVLKELGEE